jgi:hypothetical protein
LGSDLLQAADLPSGGTIIPNQFYVNVAFSSSLIQAYAGCIEKRRVTIRNENKAPTRAFGLRGASRLFTC